MAYYELIMPIDKYRLEQATIFIGQNLHVKLRIDMIADSIGFSKSTLIRHFHVVHKISPGRYILEARMKKAFDLLVAGNNSVSETGQLLGYKKCSAFTHAFKRYFGVTPIQLYKTVNTPI